VNFEHITDDETVAIYSASNPIFGGILKEIRELSKKKPDATMSEGKVKIVNRVLNDLKSILESEPEGKYLDLLSDETLPQVSDAVLIMVQFETALICFASRYRQKAPIDWGDNKTRWVTPELIKLHNEFLESRNSYLGEE